MQIANGIYIVEDILSPQECQECIDLTENLGYESAPITTPAGFVINERVRNNTRVMVDDVDRAQGLWERLKSHLPATFNDRKAIGLNERFRFYRYDQGEKFAPHTDGYFRRDNDEQSLLTLMVYLNEGCEGGETNLLLHNISVKPKTGMALAFDHGFFHEGAAVRSGRKYVLRSDVMFESPYAHLADHRTKPFLKLIKPEE